DCVSICSPNYLHDAHIRAALRWGASAICEKPIVINPWNLDALLELEAKSEGRVHPVLQLRLHPAVQGLRGRLQAEKEGHRHQVSIRYITPRGSWYQYSWKGDIEKSGGLAMNIGVHFFDMLIWLFGGVQANTVAGVSPTYIGGELALERADVRWFLSVDRNDLPSTVSDAGNSASRSIQIDGEEIDFTKGFADLHTQVYEEALAGRWFGMQDALPAIELVHDIREKAIGIL
ncbi:MAG: Gfo/Idh/MocA family oxidoreductase, partial [Kiritimatiellia bacterium]|nr:Gfo/Idh/MocA family oxidoreductase [Kiritimatiellia bacterium]